MIYNMVLWFIFKENMMQNCLLCDGFHAENKFLGDHISWGSYFFGTIFLGDQISQGHKIGGHFSLTIADDNQGFFSLLSR